jgi:hypothetical protein
MQKYSMSNKASIMSVLTLVISLVVIGLVSTGCGGGGGPTTYTLVGTVVNPANAAVTEANYGINVNNGLATGTSGASGAFSIPIPGSVIGVPTPSITLTFTYPNGGLDGNVTIPITGGMINGTTINLGDVPAGPPTTPPSI